MREQEPKSLAELHEKRVKTNRALAKVDTVSQTIGTSTFNRHLNLSRLSGEEFLDAAVRVGRVKEALEEHARPTLQARKEETEREIENFDRIQRARQSLEQIRQFVQRGLLPRSALSKAEEELGRIRTSIAHVEVTPKAPVRLGRVEPRPVTQEAIVTELKPEEEKPLTTPDGKKIPQLTPFQRIIVKELLAASEENPIPSRRLASILYDDDAPERKKLKRVDQHIRIVTKKLWPIGWKIVNVTPNWENTKGKPARYHLTPTAAIVEREKEKVLVLPDGTMPPDLLPTEAQMLEGLLCGSQENPVSRSELVHFVYGDDLPKDQATGRFSNAFTPFKRKLETVGWRVVNLTPRIEGAKGKETLYCLAPIEEQISVVEKPKEEKPKLVFFKDQNQIEIDGRKVELNPKQLKILQVLAKNIDQRILTRQLSEEALGDSDPIKTCLRDHFRALKAKINPKKGEEFLVSEARAQRTWYMLKGMGVVWPEEVVPTRIEALTQPEVAEKVLPKWVINRETQEVEIGGQIVKVRSRASWAVLLQLAKNSKEKVDSEKIAEVARKARYNGVFPAGNVINHLREIFEADPKNPICIVSFGRGKTASYTLLAEVEFVGESERAKISKAAAKIFEVTLPDGQIVKVQGELKTQALERLVQTSKDSPVQTDELAISLYGAYNKRNYQRVSSLIGGLQSKVLESLGYKVFQPIGSKERGGGQKAAYYLEKIVQVEKAPTVEEAPTFEEIPPSEEEIEEGAKVGIPLPVEVRSTEEAILIPYEPSEEEKRSEEETRILDVVVSSLLSNSRLHFDELQRQLYSEKRVSQIPGGGLRFFIYQAPELKERFVSAFRKIREEAEIAALKEAWKETDRTLWEKVQSLAQRLSGGDVEDFVRKIRAEVDRAEREFYRHYPSEGNQKRPWIRI